MIDVKDLTKRYRVKGQTVEALSGVSVQFPDGTYAGVTGPSGSGKSTLLFSLAGLVKPTAGAVTIDGQSVYDLPAGGRARLRAERIGFVFQMFYLVPYLTVAENVAVALGAGPGGKTSADRVGAVLERVGLTHRLNHKPGQLSSGEQQRVALARAVITQPRMILADEPTGNLDPDLAAQLLDYLDEFHRDGLTIILATHDQKAAERATQRVTLQAGRLVEAEPDKRE